MFGVIKTERVGKEVVAYRVISEHDTREEAETEADKFRIKARKFLDAGKPEVRPFTREFYWVTEL